MVRRYCRGMDFRILGPLEVADGNRQLQLGGTREPALLAILLIHAGEVVSADRLIEEPWGSDLPGNPSNALQVVVSRVRKALEDPASPVRLVTRKPGYLLDVGPEELDAGRFGRLVEEARLVSRVDQVRELSLLEEALGLWRGPALAEFATEGFAREEIARLEEERICAIGMKAEAELALGRHARLVAELRALVAANPLREGLRGQLMLALYRSGCQGEALRVFQEGRSVLADELGVDPGPELQELHQQILLQAASLLAVPEASAMPGASAAPQGNLPTPVTSFVGRRAELAEAEKLLRRSRLVTLTGPGGSGKTRLAVELARTLLEGFADGAWLVELEAVSDPAMVPGSLAAVLGIGESASLGSAGEASRSLNDKLIDYLRGKELLVVLDNCEHLIDACAQVAERVLRLRALECDRDNFSAAMDCAFRSDADVAVRLTSALAYFWMIGRRRSEVRQRLAEAVNKARGASPAHRARALTWAALLADVEGRAGDAVTHAREAYKLSKDAADPWWLALSEAIFGLALGLQGQISQAGELLDAGLARFRQAGDGWGAAIATMLAGYVTAFTADRDRAAALARGSLDGFRAAGDQWGQTMALELLGLLDRRQGAFDDAVSAYEEALGVVRDLGLRDEVPFLLADLGDLQVLLGNFETAAVLHKEALDLAQDLGARDAAALARSGLALVARRQSHYGRARDLHLQALSFYRETARTSEMAYSLASLGYVEELRGDLDAADAYHQESLRLTRDLPDLAPVAFALEGLACVAAARRQPRRAAVLLDR